MFHKKSFILILVIAIVFSVNVIAATDLSNVSDYDSDLDIISDDSQVEISENNPSLKNTLSESVLSENTLSNSFSNDVSDSSEEYIIHIGKNRTKDGDGSSENPFASFDLACNNIEGGKNKVIINVEEGTYDLNSILTFNTSNLYIKGLSENVIIKNVPEGAFALSSPSGNFTMSNIIIDGDYPLPMSTVQNKMNYIFDGVDANLVTFNNCTINECWGFLTFKPGPGFNPTTADYEPYIFNNCKFSYALVTALDEMDGLNFRDVIFKNCIFNIKNTNKPFSGGESGKLSGHSTVFEDCWFGINGFPNCFYKNANPNNAFSGYEINRYAIFSMSVNCVGNHIYEIIGKLSWNDSTIDGFENLNPMDVNLLVDYGGKLDKTTAILKNGTFKVQYTSTSADNKVTATLDNQPVPVEFKNINISLDSPIINYGDKQNITVTLPESIYNGVVTVIVNGKPYTKDVEFGDAEVTVDISDVLPVGTHEVNVTFVDKIDDSSCPIYAFNTTKITVNKAIPNVNISLDGDLNPGEKLIVKVEIPYATEDVTIIVNGDKNTTKLVDNVATYTIDELAAGTYYVTVLYAGDDSYDFAVKTDSFDVVKSTQELIKDLNDTVNAQADTIVNQSKQISDLNSTVNAQADTIVNQSKQISDLNNTINAQSSTTNSQKDTNNQKNEVTKKSTKLTAPKKTFKAKTKTKKIKIKLTTGKTPIKNKKITLKVKGKTYIAITNKKGIATFKITKLTKKGTFKYTVKFAGDKSYKAVSKNGKIKIK